MTFFFLYISFNASFWNIIVTFLRFAFSTHVYSNNMFLKLSEHGFGCSQVHPLVFMHIHQHLKAMFACDITRIFQVCSHVPFVEQIVSHCPCSKRHWKLVTQGSEPTHLHPDILASRNLASAAKASLVTELESIYFGGI